MKEGRNQPLPQPLWGASAGPLRGRLLNPGLTLTEYSGQKGSKETDDFNAEGMQMTQVEKGFPETMSSLHGGKGGKQLGGLENS